MGFGISSAQLGSASNALALGGLGASVVGAYSAASGARAQASIDETNARLSELSAESALLQGQHEEQASRMATAQLKSRQRVAFASNGVDLGSESAVRTLTSTDYLGAVDANTAHANAVRSAFGYRANAVSSLNSADARRAISPGSAALTTLIGSGAQVSRQWYALAKGGTLPPSGASNPDPGMYVYGAHRRDE